MVFWTYKYKQLVLFTFVLSGVTFYMLKTDGDLGNCMGALWCAIWIAFVYIYSTTDGEL